MLRKTIIMIIILLQVFLLLGCTSELEKDALVFIDQMSDVNLANEYEFESETYGIYLSENSETVYQYKYVNSNYYINVLEERSFSYFDEDSNDYSNAKKIKYIFFVDMISNVIYEYDFELSIYEELEILPGIDIKQIIKSIHDYLKKDGKPVGFTEMYPVVYEALTIGKEYGRIDAYGQSLTFTVSIDTYLKYASEFREHLLKIYGNVKYNQVIDSMKNSPYKNVHLKFRWNSEEKVIMPFFKVFYMQIDYYKAQVFSSSFYDEYMFD